MAWEYILKKKTEKPTKVVRERNGQHFNNCDKLTGKNQRFDTYGEDDYEGPKEVGLDNCNCWEIAKDWYKESKLVREIIEDEGVGTLTQYGESSVHYNDGTDWEKLRE